MPVELLQQLSNRPVMRDWVGHRDNGLEPIFSVSKSYFSRRKSATASNSTPFDLPKHTLLITPHDTPAIRPVPTLMLHIVKPGRIRLPDIDLDARDRLSLLIAHIADNQQRLTFLVVAHQITMLQILGVMCVKGSQHGSVRTLGRFRVIDAVDQ